MDMEPAAGAPVTIRSALRPGDLGRVIAMHGTLYAAEYGFDCTFEAYVAATVAEFGQAVGTALNRLWLAELDGHLVGSIGILGRENGAAQLRWLLIDPAARGQGLGRRLLALALTFCREAGYSSVFLWTVDRLTAAVRLYRAAGFRRVEVQTRDLWGAAVAEERYELLLRPHNRPTGL